MVDNISDINSGLNDLDAEARRLLRETQTGTDDNSERIRKLEDKLANLSLITEALWTLLNKRTKLTNEDLAASIQDVIAARKTYEEIKLTCVKCNMKNSIHQKKCIYCGGSLSGQTSGSLFSF